MNRKHEAFIEALHARTTYEGAAKISVGQALLLALEEGLKEAQADKERLDWLEGFHVEVRTPLVHGSRHLFYAGPEMGDGDEDPSKIRKQIDYERRGGDKPDTVTSAQAPLFGEGISIKELQHLLPWTIPYSPKFVISQQREGHRHHIHDLLHVYKSLGRIAGMLEKIDHDAEPAWTMDAAHFGIELADLVICAMHMAKTHPGGGIDLQYYVLFSLDRRNGSSLLKRIKGAS